MYTVMFENGEKKFAEAFNILLTYQNSVGLRINTEFPIDMAEIKGFYNLGTPPIEEIAKHLKSIQGDIERIASGRASLEVVSKSSKEKELEDQERWLTFERRRRISESSDEK